MDMKDYYKRCDCGARIAKTTHGPMCSSLTPEVEDNDGLIDNYQEPANPEHERDGVLRNLRMLLAVHPNRPEIKKHIRKRERELGRRW